MSVRFVFFPGLMLMLWVPFSGQSQKTHTVDSLKNLLSSQPPDELVHTLNLLSTEMRVNDLTESYRYARQAHDLATLLNDDQSLLQADLNLGAWYQQKRISDSARFYFGKAMELTDEDNYPDRVKAFSGMAEAYRDMGQYDSSWAIYKEAEKLTGSLHLKGLQAAIANGMGVVASDMGELDTALSLYYKAFTLYRDLGNNFNSSIVMINVSAIAMDMKQYELALQYLDTALIANTAAGFSRGIAAVYNNQSICYRHLEQPDKAIQCLRKAVEVARSADLVDSQATSAHMLGNLMLDKGQLTEARYWLKRSLAMSDTNNIYYGQLVNRMALADYYLKAGITDSARQYIQKAVILASVKSLKKELAEAWEISYRLYRAEGQTDSALLFLERYNSLHDSLYKVDQAARIATLEKRYEQQKNHTRIALLEQDNTRLSLHNRTTLLVSLLVITLIIIVLIWRIYKHRTVALRTEVAESRKEQLQCQVDYQNKELMLNAMHMVRLHDVTYQVAIRLKQLRLHVSPQNQEIINSLIANLEHGDAATAWEEFETRFRNVHQDFYDRLRRQYPDLTPTEVKVCSFIRLNLTTKDIAIMTSRSIRTVENTRNRIRHKMQLDEADNLTSVLMSM